MSDEKDVPTAATVGTSKDRNNDYWVETAITDYGITNSEDGDELVRRQDVAKLINSYVEDIRSEIERIKKEKDEVDSNSDVAKKHHELQIKTLQGLLEEIK